MTTDIVAFIQAPLDEVAQGAVGHQVFDGNAGPYSCSRDGYTCECGVLDQQLDVLRPCAYEWSTHEAYRQEWAL